MMKFPDNYLEVKHLYHRAGFGIKASEWSDLMNKSPRQRVRSLLKQSDKFDALDVIDFELPSLMDVRQMSADERKELAQMSRGYIRKLNVAWIKKMVGGEALLREKMAFFWHDHFACQPKGIRAAQQYVNTLREHALGNFGDLLTAVSKSPAILQFLNNQQNRKAHPNENFAREVLELFTMGRGHYSEEDIREAARAFTGWGFNAHAKFVFRRGQHDFGQKVFLGNQGSWDGEDILRILLEQKQTARFITEKIYRFLVNEQIEEKYVQAWAKSFYDSGYDIGELIENILSSEHFYDKGHVGSRIKSPVEYLVGLMRQLNLDFEEEQNILFIQQILGQVLLQPPNVAGWSEGTAWIDSNSLMARLHLPKVILSRTGLEIETRESFAGNEDSIGKGTRARQLKAYIDWEPIRRNFEAKMPARQTENLAVFFLQLPFTEINTAIFNSNNIGTNKSSFAHQCMRFICTPEYQMC